MGSFAWQIQTSFNADPTESLKAAQREFFLEHYDPVQRIPECVSGLEEALAAVEPNDQYGLHETYSSMLTAVKEIAERPIPDEIEAQVTMPRELEYAPGEPLENILDDTDVSDPPGPQSIRLLSSDDLTEIFGTDRPTPNVAKQFDTDRANRMIGRGHAVCFPVFNGSADRQPTGLMFAGYTVD